MSMTVSRPVRIFALVALIAAIGGAAMLTLQKKNTSAPVVVTTPPANPAASRPTSKAAPRPRPTPGAVASDLEGDHDAEDRNACPEADGTGEEGTGARRSLERPADFARRRAPMAKGRGRVGLRPAVEHRCDLLRRGESGSRRGRRRLRRGQRPRQPRRERV